MHNKTSTAKQQPVLGHWLPTLHMSSGVRFEHRGREITMEFGHMNGLEIVLVDGQEVSRARNWKFKSIHQFSVDGTDYELMIQMQDGVRNWFVGMADIVLCADGKEVDRDVVNCSRTMLGEGWSWGVAGKLLLWLIPFFLVGLVVGVLAAMLIP